MAQRFVGIDLGTHHVKVVVLSSGLRGATVVDAVEVPVTRPTEDGDKVDPLSPVLGAALSTLRARGLLGETVGLCLPAGLLSYRLLSFPFADERRIAQAVAFEAEGQFPVPLDQLSYAHTVVPGVDGQGRALVTAARRDRMDQILGIFRRTGVDVKVVTAGPIAAAQIARVDLPPTPQVDQGSRPVTLMIDLGHQFTTLVALGATKSGGGEALAIRTLRRGGKQITEAIARAYDLDFEEAERAKHQDAFLPHRGFEHITAEQMESGRLVAQRVEPLLREIEHTRLWLRATYRLEVVGLTLAGGGADLSGLDAYLGEQTGLPVGRLQPGTLVRGTEGRSWTATAAALGAAYGACRRPLVQLHDTASSDAEGSWLQERMSGLVAIGVAILAFGALDTIAQVKAAEAELVAYQEELDLATKKVFGDALDPDGVDAKLASVEGQDLMSLIPQRGALEVLAMITKAATPSDLQTAAVAPSTALGAAPRLPGARPSGLNAEEEQSADGGDEAELDADGAERAAPGVVPAGPIDPSKGIVVSDELTFSSVDIRERKIELRAEANTSSAQDRLKLKLAQLGCITNILPGKVRGDARKTFEMSMDNNCYKTAPQQESSDDEEEEG